MSKHTPGPWNFVPRQSQKGREHSDWVVAGSDGYDWICLGPGWDVDYCDEANANARLIAAAPDLLEALECLLEMGHAKAGDLARAAIAKATGAGHE